MERAGPWCITIADASVFTAAVAGCLATGLSWGRKVEPTAFFALPFLVMLPFFAPRARRFVARRHLERSAATPPDPRSGTEREFAELDQALWSTFGVIALLVVGLATVGSSVAMFALIIAALIILAVKILLDLISPAPLRAIATSLILAGCGGWLLLVVSALGGL